MPRGAGEASTPTSDRELVLAFQAGDQAAYDEVYRRYVGRVRRICSRILQNPQDIDEATQETFLKAYQALGRFNGQYQLGAWLARIASNICVDHVRLKVRSAQLVALNPEHESLGIEDGPEDVVVGNHPRLDAAITEIQPLHAQALKLRALGGLSHEEMAGRLAMTPAQVKALLHRARGSFKRAWEKAEGWALAPAVGLRGWIERRSHSGTDTGSLMGATPAMGPMLFERVATSAVIVVVALSAVPTSPVTPRSPATGAEVAPIPILPRMPDRAKLALTERDQARSAAASTPQAGGDSTLVAIPVVSLLGEGSGTIRPRNEQPRHRDDGDGGLGAAETAEVVRKVRDVAEKVSELVPPPSA